MLKELLQNLDVSCFQNVVLCILAVFLPFIVVIYNNCNDEKNAFRKIYIKNTYYGFKLIIWLILSSLIFSFTYNNYIWKIVAIVIIVLLTVFSIRFFRKLINFSQCSSKDAEQLLNNLSNKSLKDLDKNNSFLKKLTKKTISKIIDFLAQNDDPQQKMLDAWGAFWEEKFILDEKEVTAIFVQTVDKAIELNKFNLAYQLVYFYMKNINKRAYKDILDVDNKKNDGKKNNQEKCFLQKLFEWSKAINIKLHKQDNSEQINSDKESEKNIDNKKNDDQEKCFLQKLFEWDKNINIKLYEQDHSENNNYDKESEEYKNGEALCYWSNRNFLDIIINRLFLPGYDSYGRRNINRSKVEKIFEMFAEHVKTILEQQNAIPQDYINQLFHPFFDNINEIARIFDRRFVSQSSQYMPKDWLDSNSKIIFQNFTLWSQNAGIETLKDKGPNIIKIFFPATIGCIYFEHFLRLHHCDYKIEEAMKTDELFEMPQKSYGLSLSNPDDEKLHDTDGDKAENKKHKLVLEKAEQSAVKIILEYFASNKSACEWFSNSIKSSDTPPNQYLTNLKELYEKLKYHNKEQHELNKQSKTTETPNNTELGK